MDIISLNNYEIAFPLKVDTFQSAAAADGGTLFFSFTDDRGTKHDLYVDGRIGTNTRDHLYAVSYPKLPESRYIGYFPEFVARIKEEFKKVHPN